MKMNNTESTVAQSVQKSKNSTAKNLFPKSANSQNAPKPIQNLKRSSLTVQSDNEFLPKVQKMTTTSEIKPVVLKDDTTEVVQFTYDDKEACSVTSSNNSEASKQAADLEDEAIEEIGIDEIPNLTGNESGLIKIETDHFEQLPVSLDKI